MTDLGFSVPDLTPMAGGIEFKARPEQIMNASLHLKTPLRILMRLARFKATSFSALEKKITALDWELHLPVNGCPDIRVTAKKSRLYHSGAVAQRVQTTILKQLGIRTGLKTDRNADHTLFVRADHDAFTLSLDTTGAPFFKRGIKTEVTPAPLRESIASAMLTWAGFSKDDILIDPMCGSGTFSIEAALSHTGTPPGYYRSFAFESLPGFSQKAWQHLKKQAADKRFLPSHPTIFASDADAGAITAIKENIKNRDFARLIDIRHTDFFTIHPDQISSRGKKGLIALNPPYGKRLKHDTRQRDFYRDLRNKLRSDFKGWRLAIILPAPDDLKQLDLKLKSHPIFHGGVEAVAGIGVI